MPNLNKVLLMGHLTRDPELRVTPKETAICQFGLAINRESKTDGGEKKSEVTFIDCEAWAKTGETIAKYLTKGRALYVEGRLKLDQWEDKNTHEKRSRLKVVVENFQFLGGKDDAPPASSPAPASYSNPPPARPSSSPSQENLDDDVPF